MKRNRMVFGVLLITVITLLHIPMNVQATPYEYIQELQSDVLELDPLAADKIQGKLELESWV